MPRTHRISLAWLSEVVGSLDCVLMYVRSEFQAAGIFTKPLSRGDKLAFARELVSVSAYGHDRSRQPCV